MLYAWNVREYKQTLRRQRLHAGIRKETMLRYKQTVEQKGFDVIEIGSNREDPLTMQCRECGCVKTIIAKDITKPHIKCIRCENGNKILSDKDRVLTVDVSTAARGFQTMLIDKEDYTQIIETHGRISVLKNGYAAARRIGNGTEYIHHLVTGGIPPQTARDHINRNRLDNRRCNLRIVTQQKNNFNKDRDYGPMLIALKRVLPIKIQTTRAKNKLILAP